MAVNVPLEVAAALPVEEPPVDFEAVFRANYERMARVIARIGDPARTEELAAEIFLKLWRSPRAHFQEAQGWLYKTAVRRALDELSRRRRRARYEGLFRSVTKTPTPEEVHAAREEQERVRRVLSAVASRQAEILVLRSQGFSYGNWRPR